MKNLKFIVLTCIAVLSFAACQQDDDLEFVATEATDLAFSTTFLDNYVLNSTVSDNLAERFTWNNADFGVATNVTYSLQAATLADFSDYIASDELYNLGNTSGNEIPVTVGQMIDLAEAAGLDNDPATEASNVGSLYFRLMAVVGDEGLPTMSDVQALNVELQEQTEVIETGECEVDILYAVGAGLPTAGWDWGTPVELACTQDGVWSGNVEFSADGDANFRFFTVSGDWATGRNYPYYVDAGYAIDSNFENAMDDDNNFKFVGTSGVYFLTIDTNSLQITLGPAQGDGTCEFDVIYGVGAGLVDTGWDWGNPAQFVCTADGVWSGSVALQNNGGADNNFRFFTILDDWASGRNYPFYVDAGYTIDSELVDAMDDDNNFAFIGTTGTYTITIDTNNLTINLD
ncbi:MAG: SusF/SusE family outer membrane protein [Algicola sp.]|nr:SusF/SusE family outer membrane protein [Algicola sp.]